MPEKPELQLITRLPEWRYGSDGGVVPPALSFSLQRGPADLTGARRVLGRRAIGFSFCVPEFQLISRRLKLQDLDNADRHKPLPDAHQELSSSTALHQLGRFRFRVGARSGPGYGADPRGPDAK